MEQPAPSETPAEPASTAPTQAQTQPASGLSRDQICEMIESAASAVALPFEFMARLIWQESEFNPRAVSPAGAQGIAQFMPKTADHRGLSDPFDPAAALRESAEFLRELRDKFGNLGLAAAAYNAGPKRVQDWLAKRNTLPRETQNYVHIITGQAPEKWAAAQPPSFQQLATKSFHCAEIAKLVAERRALGVVERLAGLVAQRLGRPRGEALAKADAQAHGDHAEAAAPRRNSSRNRLLGKRVAPPRGEQVAKSEAAPGKDPRINRTIRMAALSRHRAHVNDPGRDKSRPRNDAVAHDHHPPKAGRALPARASSAHNVHVAANGRAHGEKSCSQVRGGHKACRAA